MSLSGHGALRHRPTEEKSSHPTREGEEANEMRKQISNLSGALSPSDLLYRGGGGGEKHGGEGGRIEEGKEGIWTVHRITELPPTVKVTGGQRRLLNKLCVGEAE